MNGEREHPADASPRPRSPAGSGPPARGSLGFGIALAALLALPTLFGYRTLTVRSGSMEPTLEVGSVVINKVSSPLDVAPGDIVTFADPGRRDQLVTHRLRRMRVEGRTAYMVTRGDSNDTVKALEHPH